MTTDPILSLPLVTSAAAMREADRRTIHELGIPGFALMETAGRAVASEALFLLEEGISARIVCLCGKGNNGGDGFVAARVLHSAGCAVEVLLTSAVADLEGDAGAQFAVLEQISKHEPDIQIVLWTSESPPPVPDVSGVDLFIDALLGTGLASNVRAPLSELIHWLNDQARPVLSIDLPSGLSADSGQRLGTAVEADVTVTLGAVKTGLFIGNGPDCAGAVVLADIGIPDFILEEACREQGPVRLCQEALVESLVPRRSRSHHKYTHGPTIVIGGSDQYAGAPVLAATAAARAGSSYVVVLAPDVVAGTISEKLTEIPVTPLIGSTASERVDAAIAELGNRWEKAKALLVGPGLGRETDAKELVMEILGRGSAPAVIDADALFALIGEKEFVQSNSNGNWVFTPHEQEFSRLNGSTGTPGIEELQKFAADWDVVVLMKGMPSISVAPSGDAVINDTGNPAAATAGSGDVLSGIVAGFLAQGLTPLEAAVCGIHIAGAIADDYTTHFSANTMMAGDVLEALPKFLAEPG